MPVSSTVSLPERQSDDIVARAAIGDIIARTHVHQVVAGVARGIVGKRRGRDPVVAGQQRRQRQPGDCPGAAQARNCSTVTDSSRKRPISWSLTLSSTDGDHARDELARGVIDEARAEEFDPVIRQPQAAQVSGVIPRGAVAGGQEEVAAEVDRVEVERRDGSPTDTDHGHLVLCCAGLQPHGRSTTIARRTLGRSGTASPSHPRCLEHSAKASRSEDVLRADGQDGSARAGSCIRPACGWAMNASQQSVPVAGLPWDLAGTMAARMAAAANRLVALLDIQQRERALLPFAAEAHRDWGYTPRTRPGLPLRAMRGDSVAACWALVEAGLGPAGWPRHVVCWTWRRSCRSAPRQRLSRPAELRDRPVRSSGHEPWAWRFEGHHVSLTFTLVPGIGLAVTPHFFGANPFSGRVVPDGQAGSPASWSGNRRWRSS